MKHKPFDKAINDSLKNLEVDYNAAHWQQMEMLLNNLPIGDETDRAAHFDALIKNKITNIEVPIITANWAAIEATLTQAESADAQFDTAINNKITHLEDAPITNWADMEQALAVAEAADAQFDSEVNSKLQNLQPSFQLSHWHRLLAKLNADFAVREKLYRYKLLEATLMILLLLNFYQNLPSNYVNSFDDNIQKNEPLQLKETSEEQIFEPIIEEKTKQLIPNLNKQNQVNTEQNRKPLVTDDQSFINKNELEKRVSSDKNIGIVSSKIIPIKTSSIFHNIPSLVLGIGQNNNLRISVSEMNQHLSLYTRVGHSLISTIPSLKPNFVETLHITPLNCKDCKHTKVAARLRVGIIANIALNNAYRAGGQILDINALNQKGFGYGSGFSLGFKYGRWEIETGLAYAAKRYDPNIIEKHGGIVSGGISQTHFQTVHLQTLHIPAILRYNYAVLNKGKWHFYTQAGVSMNVILRAEYDLAETTTPNGRFKGIATTTSRLSRIDYNNGLLAGDGFKNNRFLAISIGGGTERYISPRWSIFLQPDFHFHFSGNRIGPLKNRINTLSLSFGARKSF